MSTATDELRGIRRLGSEHFSHIEALIEERDELLEALKLADFMLSGANMDRAAVERKVRAAIAKAEGGVV